MTEPHTADLQTRYRYRLEGAQYEREQIIQLLTELRDNWNRPASFNYRRELTRIMELIEERNK